MFSRWYMTGFYIQRAISTPMVWKSRGSTMVNPTLNEGGRGRQRVGGHRKTDGPSAESPSDPYQILANSSDRTLINEMKHRRVSGSECQGGVGRRRYEKVDERGLRKGQR